MAEKTPRRDFLKAAAALGVGFAVGSWALALSRGKAVVEVTSEHVKEVRVRPEVQVQQVQAQTTTTAAAPPHPAFQKRGFAFLDPANIQER